jgi:hypothetical protein
MEAEDTELGFKTFKFGKEAFVSRGMRKHTA